MATRVERVDLPVAMELMLERLKAEQALLLIPNQKPEQTAMHLAALLLMLAAPGAVELAAILAQGKALPEETLQGFHNHL